MTGKNIVRRCLSVFILTLALLMAVPVFGATERRVNLKLKSSSTWLKKSVKVGNKIRLSLSYNDIELLNENVSFMSSKPSVAYVSSTGLITAKKAGSAVVTAKFNGRKAGLKITVGSSGSSGSASSLRTRIVNYANQTVEGKLCACDYEYHFKLQFAIISPNGSSKDNIFLSQVGPLSIDT